MARKSLLLLRWKTLLRYRLADLREIQIPDEKFKKFLGLELVSSVSLFWIGATLLEYQRFAATISLFSVACVTLASSLLIAIFPIRSTAWRSVSILATYGCTIWLTVYLMGVVKQAETDYYAGEIRSDVTISKQTVDDWRRAHPVVSVTPQSPTPEPTHKPKKLPPKKDQEYGLQLTVSLVNPTAPDIIVDNQTDDVVDGVTWELVLFRTTDQAFFSYATQNIGYIKPHSKSARYAMNLNTRAQAPGGAGQIANGDNLVGTLVVDCPSCAGTSLIVSFVWGSSGWFYQVVGGDGKLFLPKDPMSKDSVSQYIESINATVKPEERTPILNVPWR